MNKNGTIWKDTDGNPCLGEGAQNTYGLQFTSALELHDKPNHFLGLADKWNREDIESSAYVMIPFNFNGDNLEISWCEEWSF